MFLLFLWKVCLDFSCCNNLLHWQYSLDLLIANRFQMLHLKLTLDIFLKVKLWETNTHLAMEQLSSQLTITIGSLKGWGGGGGDIKSVSSYTIHLIWM